VIYRVRRRIPALQAEVGDYLIVRPDHTERPFVLQRNLPRSLMPLVDPQAVETTGPHAVFPPHPPPPHPVHLKLVG
jgi:hypothetical protein